MTVDAASVQALIVLEVGEVWQPAASPTAAPVPLLASNMAAIWDSFSDKASVAPRLQELYAKRRCIDLVLATVRDLVDFAVSNDYRSNQGQRFQHLQKLRDTCDTEITKVEQQALSGRAGAVGALANTEMEPVPTSVVPSPYVSGNDPRYRGDLYQPGRFGGWR